MLRKENGSQRVGAAMVTPGTGTVLVQVTVDQGTVLKARERADVLGFFLLK